MASSPFRSQLDAFCWRSSLQSRCTGTRLSSVSASASEGTFELPEGTVYPVLHRLERERMLTSEWAERSGRRTRVYRVTEPGRQALAERRTEWLGFRRGVDAILEAS